MPIVDVEVVLEDGESRVLDVRDLASAIGEALEAPAGSTWVRLRYSRPISTARTGPSDEAPPVFVGC